MFFGQPRAIGDWKILLLGLPFQNLFMNIFSYLSRKKGGGGGGGGGCCVCFLGFEDQLKIILVECEEHSLNL